MATVEVNGQIWGVGSSPTVKYKLSYSKRRTSNTKMEYTFTVSMSTTGWFGTGVSFDCRVGVYNGMSGNNGYTYGSVNLKSSSVVWTGNTITKTITLSNINSSSEWATQQVNFEINVTTYQQYSYSNNNLHVVSAPMLTTAASAPTSFTASPNPFSTSVGLSWSGAAGGIDNQISGYEIQYRTSSDGSTWGSWHYLKDISTTSTSGSTTDIPGIPDGAYQQFAIRAKGSAGSNYYSGWCYSNIVRKEDSPGVKVCINGVWVKGRPYVCVNGSWVKANVRVGSSGEWKNGKD